MKTYRLEKEDQGELILEELNIADTFTKRLKGLMGKTLKPSEGLLIRPCNSIHCFFMKQPIDVLFMDQNFRVIKKITEMKPWTISPVIMEAKSVIEGHAGVFKDVRCGDSLKIIGEVISQTGVVHNEKI